MSAPFLALFVSFLVAALLTPLVRWLSLRHGHALDVPGERSSHQAPTPRAGGVAIIAGIVMAVALFGVWRDFRLVSLLAWGGIVAALSLLDDFRSIRPVVKLLVHVVAAVFTVVLADVTLKVVELPSSELFRLGVLAIPVTLFWIIGLTNAYNFMDGVNGMAGLEAVVAGGVFAGLFLRAGDSGGAFLSLSVVGAAAGFLLWNIGGRIFMGDVGSATLGFLFAVLALRLPYWEVSFIAAILPLLPFLLDTGVTLILRASRGEALFSAHRSHFYQRLVALGWPHLAVSVLWGSLSLAGGVVSLFWAELGSGARVAAMGVLFVLQGAIGFFISVASRRGPAASNGLPPG